ncbi:hypothetical protein FD755_019436 [Muntiacus reevesi]|uniref:protein-serine/threonine phosphatase n=1 Tax=Muntiacus reevesi TaxID=9886 RepID=A0A5N3X5L8_MUNRE|nr:hypothetical protein FD755_019436 [Muntiacus reevesi]
MRGSKLRKDVWLQENEKKELCLKFHQIFLSQPILLELEALLKIVWGMRTLETICLLLAKEKKNRFSSDFFSSHKKPQMCQLLCLPVAAFTFLDKKILCCSGGLSPDLQSVEQIWKNM